MFLSKPIFCQLYIIYDIHEIYFLLYEIVRVHYTNFDGTSEN